MKGNQARFAIEAPVLTIGADVCAGVPLDLERMYTTRLLVQGSSRSGKTHLLRYLIERTHGSVAHFIVDWEGELWTLKDIFPEYVWVGNLDSGSDLAARPERARHDCRRMVSAGASIILDLSDLDDEERYETARLWLEEAFEIHGSVPLLTLVIFAEVHELCPQQGEVPCSDIVRRIWARGGKRGLVPIADTQRIAEVHKRITDVGNFLIGRTTGYTDIDGAAKKLGLRGSERAELETLPTGTFYGYGPAIGDGRPQLVRSGEIRSVHPDRMRDGYRKPPTAAEIAEALTALRDGSGDVAEDGSRLELLEEIERLRAANKKLQEGDPDDMRIRAAVDKATRPLHDQIRTQQLMLERAKHHARAILLDLGEIPEENHDDRTGRDDNGRADERGGDNEGAPENVAGSGGANRTDRGQAASRTDEDQDDNRNSGLTLTGRAPQMLEILRNRGEMQSQDLAESVGRESLSSLFRRERKQLVDAGLAKYTQRGYIAPCSEGENG